LSATQPVLANRHRSPIPAASQLKEKHMIIGKFTYHQDGGMYLGELFALATIHLEVGFYPEAHTTDKAPDYRVYAYGYEIGAAWKKTSIKGNAYLSVKLDSPFMDAPVNCALVQKADGFALVWNRKEAENEEAAA
jgi:uncharacterized protein (DUF736 family)